MRWNVEYGTLGNSGCTVSALGLGTMTFGHETDEAGAHAQLDMFLDSGGTFVDTADVYSRGVSELMIGSWLASRGARNAIVLATKARFPMSDSPLDSGASRRYLLAAVDASLGRLGVDHVDLYQVHGWDPVTPLEETLDALSTIVESGRARYVGWSNITAWQMQRIVDLSEMNGWTPPVTVQPQYNLLDRAIEVELMPMSLGAGLGILPWSPLGGGWLSGKYSPDEQPTGASRLGEDPNRGVEAYDKRNVDRTWRILDVVNQIAETHDASMAQIALAWLTARPGVSSVLLGARTTDQLMDNLGVVNVALTPEQHQILTEVSAPGIPPYPYGMIRQYCGVTVWDDLGAIDT